MDARQFLNDTIDLFLEFRDRHGHDESRAQAAAVCESLDALTPPELSKFDRLLAKVFSTSESSDPPHRGRGGESSGRPDRRTTVEPEGAPPERATRALRPSLETFDDAERTARWLLTLSARDQSRAVAAAFDHLYWLPLSAAHYQTLIDQGLELVSECWRWHPPVLVEAFRAVAAAVRRADAAGDLEQCFRNHESFLTAAFVVVGFLASRGHGKELLEVGRIMHEYDHGDVATRVKMKAF